MLIKKDMLAYYKKRECPVTFSFLILQLLIFDTAFKQ